MNPSVDTVRCTIKEDTQRSTCLTAPYGQIGPVGPIVTASGPVGPIVSDFQKDTISCIIKQETMNPTVDASKNASPTCIINQQTLDKLFAAAVGNIDLESAKVLILTGANVDCIGDDGIPLIWHYIPRKYLWAINFLIEHKADVNIKHENQTFFEYAAKENRFDIVKRLCEGEYGYKIENDNPEKILNLHTILVESDKTMCKYFLEKFPKLPIDMHDSSGLSLLYNMVCRKLYDMVELLLNKGADPNIRNNTTAGGTPMGSAVYNDDIQMVKLLLKSPTINVAMPANNKGQTALDLTKNSEIISLLKAHVSYPGSNCPNCPNCSTDLTGLVDSPASTIKQGTVNPTLSDAPKNATVQLPIKQETLDKLLVTAMKKRNHESAEALILSGANPNCIGDERIPLIWEYMLCGYLTTINFLIKHKADANIKHNQQTFFQYAVKENRFDIVKRLCEGEYGYKIENDNLEKILNLHTISTKSGKELFKYFLEKFPKLPIDMHDSYGLSILYCMVDRKFYDMVELLLNKGANPNIKNQTKSGETPLLLAVYSNDIKMVKLLLKPSAINVHLSNNKGESALDLAKRNSEIEIIILLKAHASYHGSDLHVEILEYAKQNNIKLDLIGPKDTKEAVFFDKDGKTYPKVDFNKNIIRIGALDDGIPVTTPMHIKNKTLTCFVWDLKEEKFRENLIKHEEWIIDVVKGKMKCHNHPTLGYIQFDELTMPNGEVRKRAELYY